MVLLVFSFCKLYIGETGRAYKTRIQEHQIDVKNNTTGTRTRSSRLSDSQILHKSAITDHATQLNHVPNWYAKILGKESNWFDRRVKESLWIRKTPDNMNRDTGGHELSHLYDDIIQDEIASRRGPRRRPVDGAGALQPSQNRGDVRPNWS